jgi:hypothetical protein
MRSKLAAILVLAASGCTAHRAAMPSGYAMLPSFPEAGDLVVAAGATPLANTALAYDLRTGARVSEELALGFVATGPLEDRFDDLVPSLQLGLETSVLIEPLAVDVSFGMSQSAFFVGGRLGVARQHRWAAGRWGVRGAAALFGAAPFGASCGGEFVSCPSGPTRSALGAEASLAFGARLAGVEVVVGPRAALVSAADHGAEIVYGLVVQLETLVGIEGQALRMRAPGD